MGVGISPPEKITLLHTAWAVQNATTNKREQATDLRKYLAPSLLFYSFLFHACIRKRLPLARFRSDGFTVNESEIQPPNLPGSVAASLSLPRAFGWVQSFIFNFAPLDPHSSLAPGCSSSFGKEPVFRHCLHRPDATGTPLHARSSPRVCRTGNVGGLMCRTVLCSLERIHACVFCAQMLFVCM